MADFAGITVTINVKKGEKTAGSIYAIQGTPSGQPIASFAEGEQGLPLLGTVYCSFREADPTRLFLRVFLSEPFAKDGTYQVNVMLAGATGFILV